MADYPDAVCVNPTDNIVYLGEAKATAAQTIEDIKWVIDSELPRFIPFILTANSLDNTPTKMLGVLVGTTVLRRHLICHLLYLAIPRKTTLNLALTRKTTVNLSLSWRAEKCL